MDTFPSHGPQELCGRQGQDYPPMQLHRGNLYSDMAAVVTEVRLPQLFHHCAAEAGTSTTSAKALRNNPHHQTSIGGRSSACDKPGAEIVAMGSLWGAAGPAQGSSWDQCDAGSILCLGRPRHDLLRQRTQPVRECRLHNTRLRLPTPDATRIGASQRM